MSKLTKNDIKLKEPIVWHKGWDVPYRRFVGSVGAKFLRGLGTGKILAIRCEACKKTIVPPQNVCPFCFAETGTSWVELSGYGSLVTYTTAYYTARSQPVPPPYVMGLIKLDAADTSLVHYINEVDVADVSIGMRLAPVFQDMPKGNILDLKYFKPM